MSDRQTRNIPQNGTSVENSEYIDLHVKGCGYLSRIRWASAEAKRGRRSDPFLCCAISAIHGSVEALNSTYFDLRVSGAEAQDLVLDLQQAVDAKKRVFVAFNVGDIYVHTYEREAKDKSGNKTGQKETVGLIKGRLLQITHAKVDGETVFAKPKPNNANDHTNQSQENQIPQPSDQRTGTDG